MYLPLRANNLGDEPIRTLLLSISCNATVWVSICD